MLRFTLLRQQVLHAVLTPQQTDPLLNLLARLTSPLSRRNTAPASPPDNATP